ncbi:MAG: helix-turn-helix transcriptional regulator [Halobacteriovoraceae bacterium]|nr:helix-turn-helix transcriptional regulator [Halobacteriovoraceae bacterium]MCB9095318.1 helix-turn-helix transcriptional regulator [Halobacteriovoraceae bacterium]
MSTAKKLELSPIQNNALRVSHLLRQLSHPQRLLILCLLSGGEASVHEILERTELSQSHLSQEINKLKAEGFISSRKEGRLIYYKLHDQRIKKLIQSLQKIFC